MGLLPDGETFPDSNQDISSENKEETQEPRVALDETNFSARQALATKAFWILGLVYGTWSLVPPTITAHMIPYLQQEVGASPAIAAIRALVLVRSFSSQTLQSPASFLLICSKEKFLQLS